MDLIEGSVRELQGRPGGSPLLHVLRVMVPMQGNIPIKLCHPGLSWGKKKARTEMGGWTMDDLEREKKKGFSYWYLKEVRFRRWYLRDTHHTPGFGFAAQLFSVLGRLVIEKLGSDEAGALIREAVERFGRERGQRIAQVVTGLGKPLTLKNWLIYSDIDGSNFEAKPSISNHDLLVEVHGCAFMEAAEKWGLGDYASLYCRYVDHAILQGYNPAVRLELVTRHESGKGHCLFRYIMKEDNK